MSRFLFFSHAPDHTDFSRVTFQIHNGPVDSSYRVVEVLCGYFYGAKRRCFTQQDLWMIGVLGLGFLWFYVFFVGGFVPWIVRLVHIFMKDRLTSLQSHISRIPWQLLPHILFFKLVNEHVKFGVRGLQHFLRLGGGGTRSHLALQRPRWLMAPDVVIVQMVCSLLPHLFDLHIGWVLIELCLLQLSLLLCNH